MDFDTTVGSIRSAPLTGEGAVQHGPAATYPLGRTVHEAFLRIADRQPDTPALITEDRSITYAALAAAGRRVAAELAEVGVARGDVVPVLVRRSPELVAVLLGVLMRGAAYAALDTRWPDQRIRDVAAAVGARAVIGEPLGDMPWWSPPDGLFDGVDPAAGVVDVDGGGACCVFLTSGSTGTPKPVLSPHQATTRLFAPGAMLGDFGPSRCMPQWAPVPWDAFTLELWSMLLTGGTSMLCDDGLPTTASLRRMIADGVDSVWLTSSLFNLIVDEDVDALHGLRQVWTGGERLSVAHVRRFLDRHGQIRLVNGYGPAESCVFVTTHAIRVEDCDDPAGIPLGRPVAGTSVVVLDGARICAPDEVGEICVAGHGLAIGYLNDADLTNRRFEEIAAAGGRIRIYRTGDRGTIGQDGLLRFVGRVDRQVKVRGFRVELGEVEAHLRAVDDVAEAIVLADRDASGSCTGLSGFYVPRNDRADPDSVRDTLARRIPLHLVPDRLVLVPNIPITTNGKADHAALRATAARAAGTGGATAPRDPLLAEVVTIVSAVSEAPCSPSTRLDTGGLTSLQAMRVCMRIGERFGVSVTPEQVMAAGTVCDLAGLLRGTEPEHDEPPSSDADPKVPLADPQVGFLLEHELRPHSKAGHCLISWLVQGAFDPGTFRAAMADVQARHESLRARYQADVEPFLMVEDDVPVTVTDLGEFADLDTAWANVGADLLRPLDLSAGEIWRANHAAIGTDRHLVALVVHHIAYDGWSEPVLVADLGTAYTARGAGRSPVFPGWPPRLASAIAARRADAARARFSRAARDYWSRLLTGLPEHSAITGLAEGGPARIAECSRELPATVLEGADRVARRLGITRFPVVIAVYATALAETLGQADFGIGVPVSVRRHVSQADVVTCLVDTVCLRLGSSPERSVEDLAWRAHRQMSAARGAYAMPFPDVVRAVNPARQRGRNPLFRTMFVHQDNEVVPLVLGSAKVRLHRRLAPEPMSELVVEVWPDRAGARIDATFYPQAVPVRSVEALLDTYVRTLRRLG
jgi:amino acid adenylation domain-containing protein